MRHHPAFALAFFALLPVYSPAHADDTDKNPCATPAGFIDSSFGQIDTSTNSAAAAPAIPAGKKPNGKKTADADADTAEFDPSLGAHITGTVTAFGSICVNGLRVSYDDTSSIRTVSKSPLKASDIKIGQVVDIRAQARDNGATIHATRITVAPTVYGDIKKINYQTGMLLVGSDPVLVTDKAMLKKLHIGTLVSVSGLPNEKNMIVASLIVRESDKGAPPPKTMADIPTAVLVNKTYVSFEGYIEKIGPDQTVTIDGRVYPATTLTAGGAPLKAGSRVISMGRVQEDGAIMLTAFSETVAPATTIEK